MSAPAQRLVRSGLAFPAPAVSEGVRLAIGREATSGCYYSPGSSPGAAAISNQDVVLLEKIRSSERHSEVMS